jgi:hypothetical protein
MANLAGSGPFIWTRFLWEKFFSFQFGKGILFRYKREIIFTPSTEALSARPAVSVLMEESSPGKRSWDTPVLTSGSWKALFV